MNLNLVSDNLLFNNKLKYEHIFFLIEKMNKINIDYSDLYFQLCNCENWIIENGLIKEGLYNNNQGVGIRAIKNNQTGFAYTNNINFNELNKCVIAASSITNTNEKKIINNLCSNKYHTLYNSFNPISNFSYEEKIDLLKKINSIAFSLDKRVKQVIASLSGKYENILVASNDGTLSADIRPLVMLSINVQVEQNGKRECGFSGGGGHFDYSFFLEKEIDGQIRFEKWVREAIRIALINLSSVDAPAGSMSVVLGPGWPGILLHEAIGHSLEGDFNRRNSSVFSGKIGSYVASELCTIVDDSTIKGLRGSITIDDEGIPGKCNLLIENGKLKSYMQDKLNAKLMGMLPTGNGRRQSYAHLPIPRMTNTYMLAGKSTPEEIVDSIKNGIYAANFNSGEVDITSGNFVFSTSEAYLIKNGRINKPVKNVTLIGSGLEVMQQISMVGNDLTMDSGIGICVKDNQTIPVGVGQPTLKLNKITVGGTD